MADRLLRPAGAAWMLAAALLLGGCASQPAQPGPDQTDALNRASIHTQLGAGYYSRGQQAVALQELKTAIQADPSYAPAYNILGLVYMDLREDGLAEHNFRQALKLDPGDSDTHNNYGWFLCQHGRVDDAIEQFLAAVKNPLYATPAKAYVNAGICSLKKRDAAAARSFFGKALAAQPRNPRALYEMASLDYKSGDYRAAEAYLNRLMQVAPPMPESLWLGLRTARKLGKKDEEASYGLQLKNDFPDAPETQALLSGHYE